MSDMIPQLLHTTPSSRRLGPNVSVWHSAYNYLWLYRMNIISSTNIQQNSQEIWHMPGNLSIIFSYGFLPFKWI